MSTHRIANIVLTSTNNDLLSDFSEKLSGYNYTVLTCDDASLENKARTAHPDLIVVDVSCDNFNGFAAIQKIKSTPETAYIPVVALAAEKTNELYSKSIEVRADDIFIHSFDIQEFIVHIKTLLRLSTMVMELERRVELAVSKNIPASKNIDHQDDTPYKILLVDPIAGDRAAIESILDGNCTIDVCDNAFDAENMLTDGIYDVAICHYTKESHETVLGLCARVRNNPRLFNLPMLIMGEDSVADRMDAYRHGVTRIVNRPLNLHSLKAKIKMLIRRQRLRWNVRNAIETTHHDKSIDAATKAYTKAFFEDNLSQQIENAQKWQKHLAVIFFSIPNITEIQNQFGREASQHLLQQIFQWVSGLSRIEDMVARYGDHEFAIALPDTPINEAQIVMHRIAGILSYTDFAVADVYQPISVWVESGLATLELGDDRDILIKRARQNIQ
ncbi:diguanylate cyclase [Terasakiella sp. A23]|uniref:diguanylate cyclase domain-containing protein n=1 Tax=Terasakiella sp. FCG-A23 TaxID=3080561 RepID=UPI0029552B3A|nr:diguanylate cyclase [Terasakiella sp. A23]MDV7340314.1 diguanylate cyclase [Terasakiella sp. A23]